MIKRTLCFGNPAYLSLKQEQLVIQLPEVVKNAELPETFKKEAVKTIPVEDVGVVLLVDVVINEQRSPLMSAVGQTTASLAQCFSGEIRKIKYLSFI